MADITFVPMTDRDLEDFIDAEIADYAAERMLDATWSPREAHDRALAELRSIITWEHEAATAERQRLLTAISSDRQRVGWAWIKLGPPGPRSASAFLCQMTVARASRHLGYGRAMLNALEAVLAAEGFVELLLNVCEASLPAKALYAAAGYEVVARSETMGTSASRSQAIVGLTAGLLARIVTVHADA